MFRRSLGKGGSPFFIVHLSYLIFHIEAAPPAKGLKLYEEYIKQLRELGPRVETGIFQAEMEVNLINHGPVTLILESTGRMD